MINKSYAFISIFIILFFTFTIFALPVYADDTEVEINSSSGYQLSNENENKIGKVLSKFRGNGCIVASTENCEDKIICYAVGAAHVNSKGVVAPRSFKAALKKTYGQAKAEMRRNMEEWGKVEDKCDEQVGNRTVNGDSSEELITEYCKETTESSAEAILKGLVNVGYAFNGETGQMSAAVGMSCSSNARAQRMKSNNLKGKSNDQGLENNSVPINKGVESSEYFNEDF